MDRDRRDDFGFLDVGRTPLVRFQTILKEPAAWVLGPPWIGKSWVARAIEGWLQDEPEALGGIGPRYCLTQLGSAGAEQTIAPHWWKEWCETEQPQPAVWLIDGVEEDLDADSRLLNCIIRIVNGVPSGHLSSLHLVLFSQPHSELDHFRQSLHNRYAEIYPGGPPEFWLARFDRKTAEQFVSPDRFPHVLDVIERNDLQPFAGYPVVLRYLAAHCRETTGFRIRDVWRGVLTALLGERSTNARARARFCTESEERFDAACRIAAVLTLTGQHTIREYSPDPTVLTIGMLFQRPDKRLLAAAREACESGAFIALPEQGAYRFVQRNVQDWLTAFALDRLPLARLSSALAGSDGSLAARLSEPARLINTITEHEDVRTEIERLAGGILLPSDAAAPSLAEAARLLDRLEDLAQSTPWGVRLGYERHEELARLGVEGLGVLLAERLRNPSRPRQARRLLIEVATATKSLEVVDAAMELTLDPDQESELRYDATRFIMQFGADGHLQTLEEPIAMKDSHEDVDHRMQALLISKLMDREIWNAGLAAIHAPPRDAGRIDHRSYLLHRLSESLTLEDAREVLPHLPKLCARHADEYRPNRLPDFLDRVIELVTQQNPPQVEDIEKLIGLVLALVSDARTWHTGHDIAYRLRDVPIARRRFYEHDVEREERGERDRLIHARWLLMPDDWEWLWDQALGRWAYTPGVWGDAYWMARTAHEKGQLGDAKWDELVDLVEAHVPGLPERFEETHRQRELERQQHEAERREWEDRDPQRRPLSERVTGVLEHPDLADKDRMPALGLLCFHQFIGIEREATGEWEDLAGDLQNAVLEVCRRGLETAIPTEIPAGQTFPSSILGEGAAFSQVVLSPEHTDWLSEGMIVRWLPSALFASSGAWPELIRVCWSTSASATESVLIKTIKNETKRHAQPLSLRMIPTECWTQRLTDQLGSLMRKGGIHPLGRRELLEQLVERCPERAEPIATEWARRPVVPDETDHLRQGGRNVLLDRNPADAMELIEKDFAVRGKAALEELHVLWGCRDEHRVTWEKWPLELLERLGRLLVTAYPRGDDPEQRSVWSTPDQELRDVRDRLVSLLLRRPDGEAPAIVDRFGKLDLAVAEWAANHRANERAGQLIPTFDPLGAEVAGALSLPEAVKILDRTGYRIIRSEDDLLDAVMEALREVNKDVGHDLPMLYQKPKRQTKKPAGKNQEPREHLEEDALQAYVRRRLQDLLPQSVDGVKVQILREDQISHRQRLDVRVIAPYRDGRRLATVVVEVKWSTNDETHSALVDQLGQRYLLGENLTHGVFLVGWTGEWRPRDGTGVSFDRNQLEHYLTRQRDDYSQTCQTGGGLRIEPFVLDTRWSGTNEGRDERAERQT
jgi:hypothetical protein